MKSDKVTVECAHGTCINDGHIRLVLLVRLVARLEFTWYVVWM